MSAKTNAPAISIDDAMRLYCPGRQGEISTIGAIPAYLFAGHCRRAAQTAKDPQACNKALDGLDWRKEQDRLKAILVLEKHQAVRFFATSYVDARNHDEQERMNEQ